MSCKEIQLFHHGKQYLSIFVGCQTLLIFLRYIYIINQTVSTTIQAKEIKGTILELKGKGEMKASHIPPSNISYVSVVRKIKLSPFLYTLFIFLFLFAYLYEEELAQLVGQFSPSSQFSRVDAKQPAPVRLGQSKFCVI